MLFLVDNAILVKNRERTYLTAAASATDTTLTVQSVDENAWSDNDFVIVGEIGAANAELVQVDGTPSDGTSLTIDQLGSGGLRYAHSADEPVYRIDYDELEFSRATAEGATKTVLDTIKIQPSDYETRYDDQTNTSGFGYVRFKNSTSGGFSPYSDAIPYTGQSDRSLAKLRSKVRSLLYETDDNFVKDEEIDDAINTRQREIINERLWTFNETEVSDSSVANKIDYAVDATIKTIHSVVFDSTPLTFVSRAQWDRLHYDTNSTAETPHAFSIWNTSLRFYPRCDTDAATTTLDVGISASDTSITVADASAFERSDYYRFKINDEVIYATTLSSDTFSGCARGQEGTTAAAHTDGDTVTERNIVYTGQKYATDLENENDETIIPDADPLAYGAAAEIANGKLGDNGRGDRMERSFQNWMEKLRDRYTLKQTAQFDRVTPWESRYNAVIHDTNQYPRDVAL